MAAKSKPRPAARKPACQVRTHVACNGAAVRKYTGRKAGDPVFYCCWGCHTYLRRCGVKLKETDRAVTKA